jgi:hypothetical protein
MKRRGAVTLGTHLAIVAFWIVSVAAVFVVHHIKQHHELVQHRKEHPALIKRQNTKKQETPQCDNCNELPPSSPSQPAP